MRKIEYNPKDLLYPEDPQELVQRVFSLRKLICQYLNKNDPNYESKRMPLNWSLARQWNSDGIRTRRQSWLKTGRRGLIYCEMKFESCENKEKNQRN